MPDLATALQKALENKLNQEKQMQNQTNPNQPQPTNLQATIDEWSKDDPRDDARSKLAHAFKPTNNVTRATFNAVRDNPRLQHRDLVVLLTNQGFNASSVGSLLTQMHNAKMVTRDDQGRYTALQAEYTPLKASKRSKTKRSKAPAVPGTRKKATKEGIAALDTQNKITEETVIPPAPPPKAVIYRNHPPAFDADQLLSTLSFAQVMALYKKIKAIVGEA